MAHHGWSSASSGSQSRRCMSPAASSSSSSSSNRQPRRPHCKASCSWMRNVHELAVTRGFDSATHWLVYGTYSCTSVNGLVFRKTAWQTTALCILSLLRIHFVSVCLTEQRETATWLLMTTYTSRGNSCYHAIIWKKIWQLGIEMKNCKIVSNTHPSISCNICMISELI